MTMIKMNCVERSEKVCSQPYWEAQYADEFHAGLLDCPVHTFHVVGGYGYRIHAGYIQHEEEFKARGALSLATEWDGSFDLLMDRDGVSVCKNYANECDVISALCSLIDKPIEAERFFNSLQ